MTRRGLLSLCVSGLGLAACGFRPVYMPTASGKAGVAQRELAAVEVATIADRPGQELRQALQERFGSDASATHRYVLTASYGIAGEAVGVQSDNSSTAVRMKGIVNWTLKTRDSEGRTLTSGSAQSLDMLHLFADQTFGQLLATEATQKRMADALADQVAMQLAVWFNNRAANGMH